MRKDVKSFHKSISTAAIILLLLTIYPLYRYYGGDIAVGFLLAVPLTFFNAAVGFYYIDKYFSASLNDFMKMVFGSMGVRLLVLALLFVGIVGFTNIHLVSFTVSLFISYILFSVIEIYFLNKKASKPDT
jgi:hypothetical protein